MCQERLKGYMEMQQKDAAASLGVSVTCLKKECRRRGFAKWPQNKVRPIPWRIIVSEIMWEKNNKTLFYAFGQLKSLKMLEEETRECICRTHCDDGAQRELHRVLEQLKVLQTKVKDFPTLDFDMSIKDLRNAVYKKVWRNSFFSLSSNALQCLSLHFCNASNCSETPK